MATLSVRNFPDRLYEKLQARAKRRSRSVSQEVIALLDELLTEAPLLSVLDLQGLGKEAWREVDAAEHIDNEHKSWD
jgi:plasmid stability protein